MKLWMKINCRKNMNELLQIMINRNINENENIIIKTCSYMKSFFIFLAGTQSVTNTSSISSSFTIGLTFPFRQWVDAHPHSSNHNINSPTTTAIRDKPWLINEQLNTKYVQYKAFS